MTGIERLRKLSETEMSLGYAGASNTLKSIADQIERDVSADIAPYDYRLVRRTQAIRSVLRDMERYVSGVEGMDDSPVARWARELRQALVGRGDAMHQLKRPAPKCRDCAHWQKDPTANNMGVCWFYYHEHEGQDCYPARRADIGACDEFMPRVKALTERDA